jgi:hypothetical protein
MDIAQISALYAGSGGGAGIDLAALGLPWIEYVRVYQPAGDTFSTEVDAVAAVPEPAALTLLAAGTLALTWSRARGSRPTPAAAATPRARARG